MLESVKIQKGVRIFLLIFVFVTVMSYCENSELSQDTVKGDHSMLFYEDFDLKVLENIPFKNDVSGYEGLDIDLDARCEIINLVFEDCFHNKFNARIKTPDDRGSLKIPWSQFKPHGTTQFFAPGKAPASLEYLTVNNVKESTSDTIQIFSIAPYGSKGLAGPSVAVDAAFDFYSKKSWNEWADDIRNLGFTSIDLILVKKFTIDEQKHMVKAFHDKGIAVTLRLYPTTDFEAWEEHPDWRQKSLDGTSRHDWRVYLCPNSEDFTGYMQNYITEQVSAVNYDGIQFAEPWLEVWGGPYPDNPTHGKYTCVCDNCRRKFQEKHEIDPAKLFDKDSELYFEKEKNSEMYAKWQDFRVDSVLRFCTDLYDAARKARPGIKIIHMHLSDCSVEPERSREYQALDLDEGIRRVKPDIMIIEDSWQEWTQEGLEPDFVKEYGKAYVERIRKIAPDTVIKAHADIGSLPEMRRSGTWMRKFSAFARESGFDSTVYYEFSLGNYDE